MRSLPTLPSHLSLALLAGSCATLLATPADACSPSPCAPFGYVAPRAGTTIPSNAVAIFYQFTRAPSSLAASVTLTTDDGATTIPLTQLTEANTYTYNGVFLGLGASLEPGQSYEARYVLSCTPDQVAPEDYANHVFTAGPDAPLPATVGTLALQESRLDEDYIVGTSSGSCVTPVRASVATLTLTPSADLVPWLPLTTFQLFVDGKQLGGVGYGADPNAQVAGAFVTRSAFEIFARCPSTKHPTNQYDDPGVTPGPHSVSVVAVVAGFDLAITAAARTVTFSCDTPPTDEALPGMGGAGGNATGGAGSPNAGGNGGAPAENGKGDENTCTLSSSPTSGAADARPLAALGLLIALRARRRPRGRSPQPAS